MKADVTPSRAVGANEAASGVDEDPAQVRREEFRSFLFFTVVMAPALAIIIVGGVGLLVWMYQLVAGPPGGG